MKPRRTLNDMARGDEPPRQIAGKPADVCPYCGCAMFANGTQRLETQIYRYVVCRKPRGCGRSFLSKQPPATLIREVDSSSGENDASMMLRIA